MRRIVGGACAIGLVALATRLGLGCGDGAIAARVADAGQETGLTAPTPEAAPAEDGPADDGQSQFPGWVHYPDVDPRCGFYLPRTEADLPPPIEWTTCDDLSGYATGCREMKTDWPGTYAGWLTGVANMSMGADGRERIFFTRLIMKGSVLLQVNMIADVDGITHFALLNVLNQNCLFIPENFDSSHFVAVVSNGSGMEQGTRQLGAGILGDIAFTHPNAFELATDKIPRDYLVGTPGVIDFTGAFWLRKFADLSVRIPIVTGSPWQDTHLFFSGDRLFWESSAGPIDFLRTWSEATGVQNFLGDGTDRLHGYADLGTDGKDMAWLESTRAPGDTEVDPPRTATLYTAPYAIDHPEASKRRLRSVWPDQFGINPISVGYGFAAFATNGGVAVVRLADGAGWLAASKEGSSSGYTRPLAITADEVFLARTVLTDAGGTFKFVRLRLDALGPPDMPDGGN